MPLELRYLCPLLQIFDMPTSLAFYRDLLGFRIVDAAPPVDRVARDAHDWVWLQHGELNLMLNTAYDPDVERPPMADAVRVAAHDDTALYFGVRDLDAAYAHLSASGIAVAAPRVASYGMRQLNFKDPDGFAICLKWPASTGGANDG